MSSSADPIIDALAVTRSGLESVSSQWANLLLLATVVVGIGVVIEVVAFVMEVLEDKKKDELRFHHAVGLAGAIYVALFIGYEVEAEYKGRIIEEELRTNNSAAQAILSDRANTATAKAVAMAEKVGGLDVVVAQTNEKVEALKATAADQKARSDVIIASLTAKQKEVETTIEAAKKDEAELAASANTITELRQQIKYLTTPRILTDEQISALATTLSAYPKTPFDLFVAQDSDSENLAAQIGILLEKAGWIWKVAPALGDIVFTIAGKPNISFVSVQGIKVIIAESSRPALAIPSLLLWHGLADDDGFRVDGGTEADSKMNPKFDRAIIHVFVGSK